MTYWEQPYPMNLEHARAIRLALTSPGVEVRARRNAEGAPGRIVENPKLMRAPSWGDVKVGPNDIIEGIRSIDLGRE